MQELIAENPELISNHLSNLLLIAREYGVDSDAKRNAIKQT